MPESPETDDFLNFVMNSLTQAGETNVAHVLHRIGCASTMVNGVCDCRPEYMLNGKPATNLKSMYVN